MSTTVNVYDRIAIGLAQKHARDSRDWFLRCIHCMSPDASIVNLPDVPSQHMEHATAGPLESMASLAQGVL